MKAKWRSMASCLKIALLLLAIGLGAAPQAYPQLCEIRFAAFNKDRYVYDPVDNECDTGGFHSAPFGNWGVTTESSDKVDGRQFDGWRHVHLACDNNDICKAVCTDAWYEWNSCTFHEWSPPNSTLYNYNNNTQQQSTTGENYHAEGSAAYSVSCPEDSDGDGHRESGGCMGTLSGDFSVSGHRMKLYELDGSGRFGRLLSEDTFVEELRFPVLAVTTDNVDCSVDYCSESAVVGWQNPYSWSSSKASEKAAIMILEAEYSDPDQNCCDGPFSDGCEDQE